MFNIHDYPVFITTIILFQLTPGPGTFTIISAAARGGVGAGMGAVFGTLGGDLVYMAAAVSGVAALLKAEPALSSVVKWAGIAYLCRFGWDMLRAAKNGDAGGASAEAEPRRAFRRAFAVALSNPKAIIVLRALFPLFMTTDCGSLTLGVMMAHVSLISLLYQSCLVLVGDRVARLFSRTGRLRLIATRLAGWALIGFGVKIALNNK